MEKSTETEKTANRREKINKEWQFMAANILSSLTLNFHVFSAFSSCSSPLNF
jgi:hypothetical protein